MSTRTIKCGVETGILLEAGTNELEILIIRVGENQYGVNVAKVREVLNCPAPTRIPGCLPAVEGSVRVREEVLPLVNLAAALNFAAADQQPKPNDRMLVMEFNQERIAFRVHDVDRIIRASWTTVMPMPDLGSAKVPVTGVLMFKQRMVQMLDFESIGARIGMTRQALITQGHPEPTAVPETCPIVFADDSVMIRTMIEDALKEAGYTQLRSFGDGAEAWSYLEQAASGQTADTIGSVVAAIITDVEMPRMDGLHLTKRIRSHAALAQLPVVLFSSIVSPDNEQKGRQVGASAQIAKPRYADLAKKVGELLHLPAKA